MNRGEMALSDVGHGETHHERGTTNSRAISLTVSFRKNVSGTHLTDKCQGWHATDGFIFSAGCDKSPHPNFNR